MRILLRCSSFLAFASLFFAASAQAELVTLNVNSGLSSLTLSGSAFGLAYTQQSAGALTTNYAGTITADLTAGVFTFAGGSSVNALVNPSGPFTSAPNAVGIIPGNYGVTLTGNIPGAGVQTVNGVYHDIVLDLTAGSATNGAATTATFSFISNTLDYGVAPLLGQNGTANLANDTGNNASPLTVSWDGTTLTIPVSFTVSGGNRVQTWAGNIVAVAVPEPSSFALLSLVGTVGFVRNRRSRSLGR